LAFLEETPRSIDTNSWRLNDALENRPKFFLAYRSNAGNFGFQFKKSGYMGRKFSITNALNFIIKRSHIYPYIIRDNKKKIVSLVDIFKRI
jgi:hypothetical protein